MQPRFKLKALNTVFSNRMLSPTFYKALSQPNEKWWKLSVRNMRQDTPNNFSKSQYFSEQKSGSQTECQEIMNFVFSHLALNGNHILYVQYLQERAALFGKPGKGKAIAKKAPAKTRKGNVSSDYDSDSEDISESEGSDIK